MVLRSYELPSDDDFDDGFEWSGTGELDCGERICAPTDEPRGSTFWSAALVIATGLVAGWGIAQFPEATQAVKDTASALVTASAPASPLPAEPLPQAASQVEPAPSPAVSTEVAAVPGAAVGEAVAPAAPVPDVTTETDASLAPADATAASEPLLKPVADPKDPNQKRALAAGLHPDVSKALLARMTAADFSNARLAVQTALAEADDGAAFIWPKSGAAKDSAKGAAQFEIKFVAGAAPDCRRYVVVVTKDRWSTTAPPMESCGADLPKRKLAVKAG